MASRNQSHCQHQLLHLRPPHQSDWRDQPFWDLTHRVNLDRVYQANRWPVCRVKPILDHQFQHHPDLNHLEGIHFFTLVIEKNIHTFHHNFFVCTVADHHWAREVPVVIFQTSFPKSFNHEHQHLNTDHQNTRKKLQFALIKSSTNQATRLYSHWTTRNFLK